MRAMAKCGFLECRSNTRRVRMREREGGRKDSNGESQLGVTLKERE